MITPKEPRLEQATELLFDESGSLKRLAERSGFSPFTYFQGADLRNLDLSGQDLTGLNFDDADLRGANLEGINYTIGSFNRSLMNSDFIELQDEFTNYLDDVFAMEALSGFQFFGRFRPDTLEDALLRTELTYSHFCAEAKIGTITLRKARRGEVVAKSTMISICRALIDFSFVKSRESDLFGELPKPAPAASQPFVQLLSLLTEGGFESIDDDWIMIGSKRISEAVRAKLLKYRS